MLISIPVPHYSVAASSVADIETAVKFANKKDLYLVIKNTGHDQLSSQMKDPEHSQRLTLSLVLDAPVVEALSPFGLIN